MSVKRAASRRTLAIFVVSIFILGSTAVYFNVALTEADARVKDLEKVIEELQSRNMRIEQQLSSLERPQGSISVFGLDPVKTYASSNRSVVTIQGAKITTVKTIFGPRTSIGNVIGSGFVAKYSSSYYIVTNFHVIDGVINATVTFWNGDAYRAEIVGSDAYSDLAVVSIQGPTEEFYPLELASSSSLKVGDPVVAIGNPFGLSGSITFGIISQLGRTMEYQSATASFPIADVIQFSAAINPGNSGGPLLNRNGMVVGITTAVVSGSQGVGFAIPSDTVIRELPFLISSGRYDMHPFLGIQGVDMNYQVSQAIGSSIPYGVLIERTVEGGPASRAGLRGGGQTVEVQGNRYVLGGDIIVAIDETRIVNNDALSTYLERNTVPGQIIQVGIVRSGNSTVVQVLVGPRPSLA